MRLRKNTAEHRAADPQRFDALAVSLRERHAQVDLFVDEPFGDQVGIHRLQRDADLGARFDEFGDRLRQPRIGDRRAGGDRQRPLYALGQVLAEALKAGDAAEDVLPFGQ
ncbi:hypothetical protein G6F40_015783 [Rhizopus arrhizus]|nr:hypothetical protein G6F40_015783 [Rhizopus arrhizus]